MIKVKMIPEEGVYCDICDKEIEGVWQNPAVIACECIVCGKHVCEKHGVHVRWTWHPSSALTRGVLCLSHLYPLMDDEGREKWGYGK